MSDVRSEYFKEDSGAITGIANEQGAVARGATWELLKDRLPNDLTPVLTRAQEDDLDPAIFLDLMTKAGASSDFQNSPYSPYLFASEACITLKENPKKDREGLFQDLFTKLDGLKNQAEPGASSTNDYIRMRSQLKCQRLDLAKELLTILQ